MGGQSSYVRGWCPGALRPMRSGDGLIVRVRPRAGALPLDAVLAICGAAAQCGNGHIDLTRRANLQIRGVCEDTLQPLLDVLASHDLLDASPAAEAVRNVIVSPLAGADPGELLDMRPLARALEHALATDETLWTLPAKFGFVLDAGGALPLDDVRADVRLKAVQVDGRVAIAVSSEADGAHRSNSVPPELQRFPPDVDCEGVRRRRLGQAERDPASHDVPPIAGSRLRLDPAYVESALAAATAIEAARQ